MYRITIEEIKTTPCRQSWLKDKEEVKSIYAQLVDVLDVAEVVSFINRQSPQRIESNSRQQRQD